MGSHRQVGGATLIDERKTDRAHEVGTLGPTLHTAAQTLREPPLDLLAYFFPSREKDG